MAAPRPWGTATETRHQILQNMSAALVSQFGVDSMILEHIRVCRRSPPGAHAYYIPTAVLRKMPHGTTDGFLLLVHGPSCHNARDSLDGLFDASCELLDVFVIPQNPRTRSSVDVVSGTMPPWSYHYIQDAPPGENVAFNNPPPAGNEAQQAKPNGNAPPAGHSMGPDRDNATVEDTLGTDGQGMAPTNSERMNSASAGTESRTEAENQAIQKSDAASSPMEVDNAEEFGGRNDDASERDGAETEHEGDADGTIKRESEIE